MGPRPPQPGPRPCRTAAVELFFLRRGQNQTELRLGFGVNGGRLDLGLCQPRRERIDLRVRARRISRQFRARHAQSSPSCKACEAVTSSVKIVFACACWSYRASAEFVSICTRRSTICSGVGGVPRLHGPGPCANTAEPAASVITAASIVFFIV